MPTVAPPTQRSAPGVCKTVGSPLSRLRSPRQSLRSTPATAFSRDRFGSRLFRQHIVRASASNNSSENAPNSENNVPATNSSWQSFLLQFPLLYSSTLSYTNDHYLEQRNRLRWWKRVRFPKVPLDTVEKAVLPEPPVELWQKFIPLGLVFFCASFNLTILQNLKDAIMVVSGGAETLPFLMSLGVLPASVAFFFFYNKLVARLPEKAVFYVALMPLLAFYAFFAVALYPAAPQLHPYPLMESLLATWPVGLHGLVRAAGHWTYSLFFCLAELWGSVVISVLFWSLANEVCTVEEAKIIYPLMGISANIALVVAGQYIKYINGTLGLGSMQVVLFYNVGTVLVLSVAMMAAKSFIDRKLLKGPTDPTVPAKGPKPKRKKQKSTFGESMALLKSSPKILNLALLVVCYGVGHRLFEFAWKGQLRVLYPSVQSYQSILADVSIWTGATTIVLMLTSRFIFQFGWGIAAVATPSLMMVTGMAFFGCSLVAQLPTLLPNLPLPAATIAALGVAAGCVTQVFARSSKYSLFDPAKEMVYIEMDKEEKKQGKAAVDLVGSQIGKSGASWTTQILLLVLGSLSAALPFLALAFFAVIVTWVQATMQLQKLMDQTEAQRQATGSNMMDSMATLGSSDEGDSSSNNGSTGRNGNGGSNGNGSNGSSALPTTNGVSINGVPSDDTLRNGLPLNRTSDVPSGNGASAEVDAAAAGQNGVKASGYGYA